MVKALHAAARTSALRGVVAEELTIEALGDALARVVEAFPAHHQVINVLGILLNQAQVQR